MSTTDQTHTKGFALLIKAPGVERRFVPLQGETISILDKNGKEMRDLRQTRMLSGPTLS